MQITVSNLGPNDATGVIVSDAVSNGLTLLSTDPSQGSYDPATGLWTVGDLANGSSATLTLSVVVDEASAGVTISDSGSLYTLDQSDTNSDNDTASVVLNPNGIPQNANLALSLAVDNSVPAAGDEVVYTLDVQNMGPGWRPAFRSTSRCRPTPVSCPPATAPTTARSGLSTA